MHSPSYLEQCYKTTPENYEDTSDTLSCPKGVQNRGVPLFIIETKIIPKLHPNTLIKVSIMILYSYQWLWPTPPQ